MRILCCLMAKTHYEKVQSSAGDITEYKEKKCSSSGLLYQTRIMLGKRCTKTHSNIRLNTLPVNPNSYQQDASSN